MRPSGSFSVNMPGAIFSNYELCVLRTRQPRSIIKANAVNGAALLSCLCGVTLQFVCVPLPVTGFNILLSNRKLHLEQLIQMYIK